MPGSEERPSVGERMAEAVASADQATTTNLRDATAAAADAVGQGASKVVDGVVGAAAVAGGVAKSAMESVVNAAAPSLSQDPGLALGDGGADPNSNREVMVEVGDTVEVMREGDLQPGRPATDQVMEAQAAAPPPTTDVADKGHTREGTVSVMTGAGHPVIPFTVVEAPRRPQPTIATPHEPTAGSARAALEGQPASAPIQDTAVVAVGDPVGSANSVANMTQTKSNLVNTVKSAVGGLLGGTDPTTAAAPAGVPDDADISEVGDFKALHERIHQEAQQGKDTSSGTTASSPGDAAGDTGAALKESLQQGMDKAKAAGDFMMQQGKEKVQEAGDSVAYAVGVENTAAMGGGMLGGLGQLVSDIATKVSLATSSEEVLAGGIVPDAGEGAGAAMGGADAITTASKDQDPKPAPDTSSGDAGDSSGSATSFLSSLKTSVLGDTIAPQSGNSARSKADELQKEQAGASDVPAAATKPSHGGRDGIAETLASGWEDLKRGGAKAPWSTTQGESEAPQDVTSNIERSRHLKDPTQKKIYDAEVVKVSPGKQQAPGGGDTRENVAGGGRSVTGTVPHEKPDHKPMATDGRFGGDKGILGGFGTGSAGSLGPGSSSIKEVAELFQADEPLLVLQEEDRAHSSSEHMLATWARSLGAAWRSLGGHAAAKPPTGRDAQQLLLRQDPSGHEHIHGTTANTMRPADEQPELKAMSDTSLYKDKASRAGEAIKDLVTGSGGSSSVAHQTADNKPDGVEHYMKRSGEDLSESLSHLPEKAGGALSTAAEIVSGVAGHLVESTSETLSNIRDHRDPRSMEDLEAKVQEGVRNLEEHYKAAEASEKHASLYEQQLERLAATGPVAERNETLGDKVLHPLTKDVNDPSHAIDLAKSYLSYKEEKNSGAAAGEGEAYDPIGRMEANKEFDAAKFPARGQPKRDGEVSNPSIHLASPDYDGAEPGTHVHATKEPDHAKMKDELRATDEERNQGGDRRGSDRATRHIFGLPKLGGSQGARPDLPIAESPTSAAGGGASGAGGSSSHGHGHGGEDKTLLQKVGQVFGLGKDKAADAAAEAQSSAAVAGDVISDSAKSAADSVTSAAGHTRDRAAAAAGDAKQAAADAGNKAADAAKSARDQASSAAGAAQQRVQEGADAAADAANRAGHDVAEGSKGLLGAVTDKLGHLVGSVVGGVEHLGDKTKEAGDAAAEKLGEAAGKVEGTWDAAGRKLHHSSQTVQDKASDTAAAARDSATAAADRSRGAAQGVSERAERGWEKGVHDADRAADSAAYKTGEVSGKVAGAAESAADKVSGAVESAADTARDKVETAKEEVSAAADAAGDVGGYVVDETAKGAGEVAGVVAKAADNTAEGAAYAAGATAEGAANVGGGLLAGVTKLVTGLLGPLEKEGAFEESAAVVVPAGNVSPDVEPRGVEKPATGTTSTTSTSSSISSSARNTYESAKDKAGAAVDSARDNVAAAAAPAGDEDLHHKAQHEAEGIKGRLQALVDDTAKAVGLVTGNAADAATAAQDAVAAAKEKLADAQWQMDSGDAPNIPAEAYTNTQDLIKARQAEAAQEAARGTAYRTSRGDPV